MNAPTVRTGLDRLLGGDDPAGLRDLSLGVIVHPASIDSEYRFTPDALLGAGYRVRSLFGPQHGARGEKQDNMIESDHYTDERTGLPVHSLYSETRKPTPEMLTGLDAVVYDLQDVGVRVYTFVWTMALAMEACAEAGVRFVVLDRPNPVGGVIREGPVIRPGFESFVGLHPVPLRHGLTVGELARWLVGVRGIDVELDVVDCAGWRRDMTWAETGLPWVMPSPNIPTVDSCLIYPGMVLVEGTRLSEGRGTTRPFELVGAPWFAPGALAERLGVYGAPGVHLRSASFQPTFHKHAGEVCHGVQYHVTDATAARPVRAAVELFRAARDLAPDDFGWAEPPYEYEETLAPIDVLWGSDRLRVGIDAGESVDDIMEGVDDELAEFDEAVAPYLVY